MNVNTNDFPRILAVLDSRGLKNAFLNPILPPHLVEGASMMFFIMLDHLFERCGFGYFPLVIEDEFQPVLLIADRVERKIFAISVPAEILKSSPPDETICGQLLVIEYFARGYDSFFEELSPAAKDMVTEFVATERFQSELENLRAFLRVEELKVKLLADLQTGLREMAQLLPGEVLDLDGAEFAGEIGLSPLGFVVTAGLVKVPPKASAEEMILRMAQEAGLSDSEQAELLEIMKLGSEPADESDENDAEQGLDALFS